MIRKSMMKSKTNFLNTLKITYLVKKQTILQLIMTSQWKDIFNEIINCLSLDINVTALETTSEVVNNHTVGHEKSVERYLN